jgi:hypothetical protein
MAVSAESPHQAVGDQPGFLTKELKKLSRALMGMAFTLE